MIGHGFHKRATFLVTPVKVLFVVLLLGIVLLGVKLVGIRSSQPLGYVLAFHQRLKLGHSSVGIVRQKDNLIPHFFGEQRFDQIDDEFRRARDVGQDNHAHAIGVMILRDGDKVFY